MFYCFGVNIKNKGFRKIITVLKNNAVKGLKLRTMVYIVQFWFKKSRLGVEKHGAYFFFKECKTQFTHLNCIGDPNLLEDNQISTPLGPTTRRDQ